MGRKRGIMIHENTIERLSRLSRERDARAQLSEPLVTTEAERHGDYEDGWTEINGARTRVKVNRGGTAIDRWLNAKADDVMGDHERAAIRYCQKLWQAIDRKGAAVIRVDFGRPGEAEAQALAELSQFKKKFPTKYWDTYENICRFGHAAEHRQTRVMVAFVAGMIAQWVKI